MTQEEKRIAIAEHLFPEFPVFKEAGELRHRYPEGRSGPVHNYFADLNACAEMEKAITEEQRGPYMVAIHDMTGAEQWGTLEALSATAAQRAECFGVVCNLWPARSDSKL